MSLDKAIEHGKEKRKQYRGSKAFDPECRNHGACEFCSGNRTVKFTRKEQVAKAKESEFENDRTLPKQE